MKKYQNYEAITPCSMSLWKIKMKFITNFLKNCSINLKLSITIANENVSNLWSYHSMLYVFMKNKNENYHKLSEKL